MANKKQGEKEPFKGSFFILGIMRKENPKGDEKSEKNYDFNLVVDDDCPFNGICTRN
jgi:hypothetical protein